MRLLLRNFYPRSHKLRNEFVERFAEPRVASPERFVWDYWHIPEQYTLLRTPAHHFFSEKLFAHWYNYLVQWGRKNLGCHDISPPWLSSYVEGCHQSLHIDNPHGPWAYVFSLTDWTKRAFSGGETLLFKPNLLNFWQDFNRQQGAEFHDLLETIAPHFNQLLVFDPRIPHGVSEVHGVRDVRKSRLVMHGWFVQPRPYVEGGLSPRQIEKNFAEELPELALQLKNFVEISGYLCLRAHVSAGGRVTRVAILTNTLAGPAKIRALALASIKRSMLAWRFTKCKTGSILTLPLRLGL